MGVNAAFSRALTEDKRPLAKVLQTGAIRLSKQQINAGGHSMDVAACAMASAIVLRRHVWLRSTTLPNGTKQKVEDLPFEGATLFSSRTDASVPS